MVNYSGSWRERKEHKKNQRNATLLLITTLILIVFFITFGLPLIVKFAAFLTELRSTSIKTEKSDTTPPPPPRLFSLPKYTNEEKVTVKGNSEPGSTVFISVNGEGTETFVGSDGTFNIDLDLIEGDNSLKATAKDSAGNESNQSTEEHIIYDKTPPELSVNKPTDGEKRYGDSQKQLSVEGQTEPDAVVNINSSRAIINSEGKFNLLTSLHDGENTFEVVAKDRAGNENTVSLSVYFYP